MGTILHLVHHLDACPVPVAPPGIYLRTYEGSDDVDRWLALRQQSFATEEFPAAPWTRADARRELLDQAWFRQEWLWIAETRGAAPAAVGTVTLALGGAGPELRPAVHWLAVLPAFRRQGLGRYLVHTLESAAWQAGYRSVTLETHRRWAAAVACYQRLGYRPTSSGRP